MFRLRRPFGSTALVATLIVCLAPPAGQSAEPQLSIPAVVGQPAAAAKSALEAAGLVVRFRVGHAAPSEALAFTAYEMQPATGTLVSRGSTVDVLLYGKPAAASDIPSALPPAAPPAMPAAAHGIVVPNVIGMSAVDARAAITQAGLTAQFHVGQAPPSAGDAFRVYDAQPAPGSQAAQGAEVKLILYAMAGGAAGAKSTSSTAPGAMPPPAATTDAQPAVSVTPPPAAAPASATAPASTTAPRRADPVPTLSMVVASIDPAEHQSYVHDFTGLLSLSIVDLQVQAGAMELKVERQFRNGRGASGLLGRGWLLNWEKFLLHDDGELAVVGPEGATHFHYDAERAHFIAASGDRLMVQGSRAICTRTGGNIETYDLQGRLVQLDDGQGNQVDLQYSLAGVLSHIDGPLGSFLHFTADDRGRITQVTASNGASVQYFYGAQQAGPATGVPIRYSYNAAGHLVRVDHPRSGLVELEHDAKARLTRRRWADGATERYEYDDAQHARRHTDALGNVRLVRHSPDGRQAEWIDALEQRSVVVLDDERLQLTGPTGAAATARYDGEGRLLEVDNDATGVTSWEYGDGNSSPAARNHADGWRTDYRYNDDGKLAAVTHGRPGGFTAEVAFNEHGLATQFQVGGQPLAQFAYGQQGLLESLTDAAGGIARLEYDLTANLLREIDPLGRSVQYEYDTRRRIVARTDPLGGKERYEYSPAGLQLASIDAAGGRSTYTYDARGRMATFTDPLQRTTRLERLADGQVGRIVDAAGNATTLEYDGRGNLVRMTNALGGVTTATYDAIGRQLTETDPAGGITQFAYERADLVSEVTDAAGAVTRYEYDEQGRQIRRTDASGLATRFEYGPDGQLARIVPGQGEPTILEHDARGRLVSIRRGDRLLVRNQYDALDQLAREQFATGREITYQYDAVGNLLARRDSVSGEVKTEYDAADQPVKVTDGTGATTTYRYDAVGNLAAVVDPLGNAREHEFDAAGQLIAVTLPTGERAEYQYDAAGNLASVRHPGGGESTFAYDGLGNLTQSTTAASGTAKNKYDAAGRLLSSTDAKGQTTTFSYDAAGRMVSKRLADGRTVRFTYDERGNLLLADDGAYPVRKTYDAMGNVTQIEYTAIQRKLQYRYDENNRLAEFIDSEGTSTTYEYDEFSRLAAIRTGEQAITLSYDAKNRLTAIAYPNGVRGQWTYDALDRPLTLTYVDKAGDTLAGWNYQYDAAGNCTQVAQHGGGSVTYSYDAAGQLLEEKAGEEQVTVYTYSAGGRRATRISGGKQTDYRYDDGDRLVAAGDQALRYDANGNLIERKTAAGVTRYVYDAENRLTAVHLPGGEEVNYGYAPTGERVWRRDAQGMTYYVTDGLHVVAELDALLNARTRYLHGPGVDRLLAVEQGGKSMYLHADRLGSIRQLTDEQGQPAAAPAFDAFGNPLAADALSICSYGFAGREFDAATGLYYNRARYYDPAHGRFLSVDPEPADKRQPLTLNAYQYALNNPLRYIDPWGAAETYPAPPMSPADQMQYLEDNIRQSRINEGNFHGMDPYYRDIDDEHIDRDTLDAWARSERNRGDQMQRELDNLRQQNPGVGGAGPRPTGELPAHSPGNVGRNPTRALPASPPPPTIPTRRPIGLDPDASGWIDGEAGIREYQQFIRDNEYIPEPPKGRMQRLKDKIANVGERMLRPLKAVGRGIGRVGKKLLGVPVFGLWAAKKFIEAEDKNAAAGEIITEGINEIGETIESHPAVMALEGMQEMADEAEKKRKEDVERENEEEKPPQQPPPTQTAATTPPPADKPLTPEEEFLRMLMEGRGPKPKPDEQPHQPAEVEAPPEEPTEPIHPPPPPENPPENPPETPPHDTTEGEAPTEPGEPPSDEATDLAVNLIMSLLDAVEEPEYGQPKPEPDPGTELIMGLMAGVRPANTQTPPPDNQVNDPPLVFNDQTLDQYRERARQLAGQQPMQQFIDNSYRERASYIEGQLRDREIAMERARQEFERQQQEEARRAAWEDYQRRLAEWQQYQQELQAWQNYQQLMNQNTYYYYDNGGGYGGGGYGGGYGGGGHQNGGMIQDY